MGKNENRCRAKERPFSDLIYPRDGGEVFVGFVCPIGTDEQSVAEDVQAAFASHGYKVVRIKLSDYLRDRLKGTRDLDKLSYFDRTSMLQDEGNSLRRAYGNDILARLAVIDLAQRRAEEGDSRKGPQRIAYFFRSLKHPEEAILLRTLYGHGFYLFALSSDFDRRVSNLMSRDMRKKKAVSLIRRDERQGEDHQQNTRDTFELADFYLNDESSMAEPAKRFVRLIFGDLQQTPTRDEYGMNLATVASFRSGDLARQVGAAVIDHCGDVIALGCNEVPKSGGGLYWAGDNPDGRDAVFGYDPNDHEKSERLKRFQQILRRNHKSITKEQIQDAFVSSRLKDITEFGRTVHAEMDAITSCSRRGVSTLGHTIYVTTFPCHNCARHIVASGLEKVVFIEPYPKSIAVELHSDSIICRSHSPSGHPRRGGKNRVEFLPFVGVAPRRYSDFFGVRNLSGRRLERKDSGYARKFSIEDLKAPRFRLTELPYLKREELLMVTSHLEGVDLCGDRKSETLKRILKYWRDQPLRMKKFSEEEEMIFKRLQDEVEVG